VPFHGPLPVSSRIRPPGSTTGPPRERIAESLCGQLLGTITVWRFAQRELKTPAILPLFVAAGSGAAMVLTFVGFRFFAFRS